MKYKINLLTRREETSIDRVIYFVLNYLRYILVITQIIVIGVFFYRFKVDQELVDLQEAAEQKKEVFQVSQSLIKEAKKEAFKLDQTRSIITKQRDFFEAIDYLLSLFPESFFLNKMKVSRGNIIMVGFTQDPQSISNFLNRLKKEARFKTIKLKNIKKGDEGLEFSFNFSDYKKTQPL